LTLILNRLRLANRGLIEAWEIIPTPTSEQKTQRTEASGIGEAARKEKGVEPEDITSLASIVPELYYDLIARIAAGAPLVAYLFWRTDLHKTLLNEVGPFWLFAISVTASYLISHSLGPVSAVINKVIWPKFLLRRMINQIDLAYSISEDSLDCTFLAVYRRIDLISKYNANGGTLLKKMEAGAALSDNLFAGFLLANITTCVLTGKLLAGVTTTILIGILLLFSIYLRRMILIGRQDSLFAILDPDARNQYIQSCETRPAQKTADLEG
jgi:hypothetical protein